MALLKEHFKFGLMAGGGLYLLLFGAALYVGIFSTLSITVIVFVGGLVAVLVGSLLPDMDAPRSPVHDSLLVLFGSIIAVIVQRLNSSYLPLLLVPIFSVWVDRNYLPSHRGFIHTIEAGVLFGFLLSVGLYAFVTTNLLFCIWCGSFLTLGHGIHLVKDGLVT